VFEYVIRLGRVAVYSIRIALDEETGRREIILLYRVINKTPMHYLYTKKKTEKKITFALKLVFCFCGTSSSSSSDRLVLLLLLTRHRTVGSDGAIRRVCSNNFKCILNVIYFFPVRLLYNRPSTGHPCR